MIIKSNKRENSPSRRAKNRNKIISKNYQESDDIDDVAHFSMNKKIYINVWMKKDKISTLVGLRNPHKRVL